LLANMSRVSMRARNPLAAEIVRGSMAQFPGGDMVQVGVRSGNLKKYPRNRCGSDDK
jgi:hypothetical protein